MTIREGIFPNCLKTARVIAISESGEKSDLFMHDIASLRLTTLFRVQPIFNL